MTDFYSKHYDQEVKKYKGDWKNIYSRPSRERDDFMKRVLQTMEVKPKEIILDAGCGVGTFIIPLCSQASHVYGIDFSKESIKVCKKRLADKKISNATVQTASITNIPLKKNSVDKILCYSVLQYLTIAEIELAIKEFARVLKKSGMLIIYFPNGASFYRIFLSAARFLKTIIKGKKEGQLTYLSYKKLKNKIENEIGPVELLGAQSSYPALCPNCLKILVEKFVSSKIFQKILGKYKLRLLIKAMAQK